MGKKNKPVGGQRYYGVNAAVFAASLKEAPDAALTLKVVFNHGDIATDDLSDHFRDDYELTSNKERLPYHPNILRSLAHFVDAASTSRCFFICMELGLR